MKIDWRVFVFLICNAVVVGMGAAVGVSLVRNEETLLNNDLRATNKQMEARLREATDALAKVQEESAKTLESARRAEDELSQAKECLRKERLEREIARLSHETFKDLATKDATRIMEELHQTRLKLFRLQIKDFLRKTGDRLKSWLPKK